LCKHILQALEAAGTYACRYFLSLSDSSFKNGMEWKYHGFFASGDRYPEANTQYSRPQEHQTCTKL
jgi:hypothetical protein